MSDRDALLAAIAARPPEDTPRLAYADWLDEHGDRPADGPTAEFIRIACAAAPRMKLRQTYAEGRWLKANWERLVPSLVERGVKFVRRAGRWVHGHAIDRVQFRGHKTEARRWVELEFWRGLVRHARFTAAEHALELLPRLLADQPLVVPVITGLRFHEGVDDEGGYVLVDDHDLGDASGALRGFDLVVEEGHAAVFRSRGLITAALRARREVRAALLRKAWALLAEHTAARTSDLEAVTA